MRFGLFFYDERKAQQDKMFILTLMLINIVFLDHAKFRSSKWRLNNNFSHIGDGIAGRNVKPCSRSRLVAQVGWALGNKSEDLCVHYHRMSR